VLKNFRLRLLGLSLAVISTGAPLLTGCASRPALPPASPLPTAAPAAALFAAGVYPIDTAQSEIRLLVYRAGPLARFGHNHVIVNRSLSGTARIAAAAGEGAATGFSLTLPVADFVVDEVQARSEEGADFSAEVSDDARSGTLHNMLSAEVLDAARFATITLDSVRLEAEQGVWTSTLSLNVAGHRSTIRVPFTLVNTDGRLIATGRVTLRLSAIGLTPFQALFGALAVQDEFDVKFKVVVVPP
jgi:hypothetical protein